MKIIKFFNLLPYIFVFVASLYQPWDADLGWHLKYGEYFFKYGRILRENAFSTQMPDFIWANTSWGIDLIYYGVFYILGFLGLTLLGALVVTLTFYFFSKAFELDSWHKAIIFPFLVILEDPVNQISFRGQTLSVMMLGLLFWVLASYQRSKKRKILFFLYPLFLFWANLHGQFILGFGILVLWVFFYLISLFLEQNEILKLKSLASEVLKFFVKNFLEVRFLVIVIFLTFLATLVHPFGFGIYTDAFLHFKNKDLQYIVEYLPFEDLSQPWWNQMIYGIFAFLGFVYIFFSGEFKKKLPDSAVVSILYGLSWWVRRYAWSMYYLGIPLLKPLANFIKPDRVKIMRFISGALFIFYIAAAIYLKLPFSQFTNMNWDIYCAAYNNCSPKAVEFIRDQKLTDNLLTLYGWGGYMIWNYPSVVPSIDGRMHLWKDEKGYSAFSEYYGLEQNWVDVDKSKYNVVLMWKEKPIYKRLETLVSEAKWKKVYEDDLAGVFVRNKEGASTLEFLLNGR